MCYTSEKMVHLRTTFAKAHEALVQRGIDHALIGGFALATFGVNRATQDIDLIADEENRQQIVDALIAVGFKLRTETGEVLHFDGLGRVDILLAKRPLSRQMLNSAKVFKQHGMKCVSAEGIIGLKIQAYSNDPRREMQDKADIQALMKANADLNWEEVKKYADLFNQWQEIERLRKLVT